MIKIDELKNPGIEFWPDVRWWLAVAISYGMATLKKDISERSYEAGFGAVQFLAIRQYSGGLLHLYMGGDLRNGYMTLM